MSTTITLAPGETMREFNARRRLSSDCGDIVRAVDRNPGLPSKAAIADETGLTVGRVGRCIRAIKGDEVPELHRIEYGTRKARGGRFAGGVVSGWFPMRLSAYQAVMDQADEHEGSVVVGITRSRAVRLVQLKTGATTTEAKRALMSIANRVGIDLTDPKFSTADEDALIELVMEEMGAA
jgi:hypothetical protein